MPFDACFDEKELFLQLNEDIEEVKEVIVVKEVKAITIL
jgi:hypothetical protein